MNLFIYLFGNRHISHQTFWPLIFSSARQLHVIPAISRHVLANFFFFRTPHPPDCSYIFCHSRHHLNDKLLLPLETQKSLHNCFHICGSAEVLHQWSSPSIVKGYPVEVFTTISTMEQCFYKWVPTGKQEQQCLNTAGATACRFFDRCNNYI